MLTNEAIAEIKEIKGKIETKLQSSYFYTLTNQAKLDSNYFYVSGGCFVSFLNDEEPKDIDLYCNTPSVGDRLKNFLMLPSNLQYIKSSNPNYGETLVEGKLITGNAITLKNDVQFITRENGVGLSARDEFDFEHCMPYYKIGSGMIYMSELQYHLCKYKLLLKRNVVSVEDRTQKFLGRGFQIYGG